jgi:hypothetical protein
VNEPYNVGRYHAFNTDGIHPRIQIPPESLNKEDLDTFFKMMDDNPNRSVYYKNRVFSNATQYNGDRFVGNIVLDEGEANNLLPAVHVQYHADDDSKQVNGISVKHSGNFNISKQFVSRLSYHAGGTASTTADQCNGALVETTTSEGYEQDHKRGIKEGGRTRKME